MTPLFALLLLAGCPDQNIGRYVAPPVVAIENPKEGDELYEGVSVGMVGVVADEAYSTRLDQLTVLWLVNNERVCDDTTLDVSGVTVCEHVFPVGEAEILLSATNPDGEADDSTVVVTVLANGAPTLDIEAPTADSSYYSDHLVELKATVSDPEDPSEDLSVTWVGAGPDE